MSAAQAMTAGQVGREWQRHEVLTAAPLEGLAALLDRPRPAGAEVPPLAHWLYFLPRVRQSLLGSDGHPLRDGFLPPAQFPRRMWAGGQVEFLAPLRVGSRFTRRSSVTAVEEKAGRSGPLVLVTLQHEVSGPSGVAIRERQDLVYRPIADADAETAPARPAGVAAPPPDVGAAERAAGLNGRAGLDRRSGLHGRAGRGRRVVRVDPVMLFRFSALTFNAHRIHYDRDYCREVEGYPGLVVHGPLIAMLMLDQLLAVAGQPAVESYSFRNHRPLFDDGAFALEASRSDTHASVRTIDAGGQVAASATAVLRAGVPS
jgi:3-methylfumaryl-CoA hydratase